jgi:TM2 domain-containing membrane protein YozV
MTGPTFGRKVVAGGAEPPPAARRAGLVAGQPRSFQPAHPASEARAPGGLEARKAAFLAEERARKARPQQADSEGLRGAFVPAGPIFVQERSLLVAYLLWFFLGSTGAHRFYLGYFGSGAAMLMLWVVSWTLIMAQNYAAFGGLFMAGLWVLGDGFLVKSLHRKTGERARQRARYAATFA